MDDRLPGRPYLVSTYLDGLSNHRAQLADPERIAEGYSFDIDIPTTGTYRLAATCLAISSGGIWQLEIEGEPFGQAFDTYFPERFELPISQINKPTGPIPFGERAFTRGKHAARFVSRGTNPHARDEEYPMGPGAPPYILPKGVLLIDALIAEGPPTPGLIEGETLRVVRSTAGVTETEDVPVWSGARTLLARGVLPGDEVECRFLVAEAAEYEVVVQLGCDATTPLAQFEIDGVVAGKALGHRTSAGLETTGPQLLAKVHLNAGAHFLKARIVDTGEPTLGEKKLRLDYLLLERTQPAGVDP